MIFNIGTNEPKFNFTVIGYAGATVTITNGKKSFTKTTGSDGSAVFKKLTKGTWKVTAVDGTESVSYDVQIGKDNSNTLNLNTIPEFTYTGSCKIVDESDNTITQSLKNWKIRFLTGGTLNLTRLNGATNGIDVFCVGGGGGGGNGWGTDSTAGAGGGGGGGYTKTSKGVTVSESGVYTITIGAGGLNKTSGGNTSAFGVSATGGNGCSGNKGANGGSGGGGACAAGGSNGGNGSGYANQSSGGAGQGSTTREFGESSGTLYAGGGGGGGIFSSTSATNGGSGGSGGGGGGGINGNINGGNGGTNTGGGGGGGAGRMANTSGVGGSGGSGIVVIRNKR